MRFISLKMPQFFLYLFAVIYGKYYMVCPSCCRAETPLDMDAS